MNNRGVSNFAVVICFSMVVGPVLILAIVRFGFEMT
jgi:hypothetical protein